MSFIKPEKVEKQEDDAYLFCHCGARGSVNIGNGWKCSFHAWGKVPPPQTIGPQYKYSPDPKAWAHRIIERHQRGENVSYIALKFARDALGPVHVE